MPYSVAYYHTNPIEQYFNKYIRYIKKESHISFEDINKTIQELFMHAFNVEWRKKDQEDLPTTSKLYKLIPPNSTISLNFAKGLKICARIV